MRADTSGGMLMLSAATVGDLPPRPHVRVTVDTPLGTVVDEMRAMRRGAVLIEEDGTLVGIFTERDLVNRVDHTTPAWADVPVRDVMTALPMVVRTPDSLFEALRRLLEGRRRHLPVVDDRGHVLGLLSIRDILSFVASKFPDDMVNLPPDPTHDT